MSAEIDYCWYCGERLGAADEKVELAHERFAHKTCSDDFDPPPGWKAIDGQTIPMDRVVGRLKVVVCEYEINGRYGALLVDDDGDIWTGLSVNLAETAIGPEEFWVKLSDDFAMTVAKALVERGLIDDTGIETGAGYVARYARKYRLKGA